MKLEITIDSDNAAFDHGNGPGEMSRILNEVAKKIQDGSFNGRCMDINGNAVGDWALNLSWEEELK